jgi:hypothetical protein
VLSQNDFVDAVFCYRVAVQNKSRLEVRNIYWPKANFFQPFIRASSSVADCITRKGQISSSPTQGTLYFGISGTGYQTTTREPVNGWNQDKSSSFWESIFGAAHAEELQPSPSSSAEQSSAFPPLQSEFSLEQGTKIAVTSSVSKEANGVVRVTNKTENVGDRTLRIVSDLLGINSWLAPNSSIQSVLFFTDISQIRVENALVRIQFSSREITQQVAAYVQRGGRAPNAPNYGY